MKLESFLVALTFVAFAMIGHGQDEMAASPIVVSDNEQGMEGGFWTTEDDYDPILRLKNIHESEPIDVQPTVFFADGTPFKLPLVHLGAAGVAQVNLRIALQSVPASLLNHVSRYGMVGISYKWTWPAIIATIRDVDEIASLSLRSTLLADVNTVHASPEPQTTHVIRGTWWMPLQSSDGFVAMANASRSIKRIRLEISDRAGKLIGYRVFTLARHETMSLRYSQLLSGVRGIDTEGGLRISYSGPAHGVLAYSAIEDASIGYSASPIFAEDSLNLTGNQQQVRMAAPGLMLGKPDPSMLFPTGTTFTPYAVLNNISDHQLDVKLTISVKDNNDGVSKTYPLSDVILEPGQVSTLGSSFFSASKFASGTAHLMFAFRGREGDLLVQTGSVDQTMNYVFEVVPAEMLPTASRTLCFWSAEGDSDSMITVWNYDSSAQDLVLKLFFTGGRYQIPIHLGPGETYTLSTMELVRSGRPDPSGVVIPTYINSGSAVLSGKGGERDSISVGVASATYNVRNATCSPDCVNCNGVSQIVVSPSSLSLSSEASSQVTATEVWNTGQQLPAVGTWSSTNSSVATASSGLITGVAAGAATAKIMESNASRPGQACLGLEGSHCPSGPVFGVASVTVTDNTPLITGIDPSVWIAGTTTSVTITGQYFGTNAPSISFSPSNGVSYTLSSYNDNQIVASVNVASGTPNEQVQIVVTNNGYGGSAFNGTGSGQQATSQAAIAQIQAAVMNTPQMTIIAWVNGNAPDLQTLPSGANSTLVSKLGNPTDCAGELAVWAFEHTAPDVHTATDVSYANLWLVKNSANPAPPNTITPSVQQSAGNFRLFNDFGNGGNFLQVGSTPNPCGATAPASVLAWIGQGQKDSNSGPGKSTSGKQYQLAEGRLGTVGQSINATLNGTTTPWIWSVIEFDSSGNPITNDHAIFPTYSVYQNGYLVNTYAQAPVSQFIQLNQSSERTPQQIP